jgi:hypothetical protein
MQSQVYTSLVTLSGAYMVFQGSTFVELLLTEVWQAGTLHSDLCAHVWTCRLGCVTNQNHSV